MRFNFSNNAFTLAEVLITLGIIGVVAALTLPTLIQNYNNGVVETRLKKFYSGYSQAVQMSLVDNNSTIDDWGFHNKQTWSGSVANNISHLNAEKFEKYLAPYLKITKREKYTLKDDFIDADAENTLYYMSDGSAFSYSIYGNGDLTFYPSNPRRCFKKTEKEGVCAFNFYFKKGKGYVPYSYMWDGNIESLFNDTTYGCNDVGNGFYCTTLIYQNGWKVPEDYPKRISL